MGLSRHRFQADHLKIVEFQSTKAELADRIDIRSYWTTGGQQTASSVTRFADVAAATNYRRVAYAEKREDLEAIIPGFINQPGPALLHMKIRPGSPEHLGRPTVKPHEVRDRFMQFLSQR